MINNHICACFFRKDVVIYYGRKKRYALLAQLDRVTGYEPVGRGFESPAARQDGNPRGCRRFL